MPDADAYDASRLRLKREKQLSDSAGLKLQSSIGQPKALGPSVTPPVTAELCRGGGGERKVLDRLSEKTTSEAVWPEVGHK